MPGRQKTKVTFYFFFQEKLSRGTKSNKWHLVPPQMCMRWINAEDFTKDAVRGIKMEEWCCRMTRMEVKPMVDRRKFTKHMVLFECSCSSLNRSTYQKLHQQLKFGKFFGSDPFLTRIFAEKWQSESRKDGGRKPCLETAFAIQGRKPF